MRFFVVPFGWSLQSEKDGSQERESVSSYNGRPLNGRIFGWCPTIFGKSWFETIQSNQITNHSAVFVGCESLKSKFPYLPSKQRGPEFEDVDEKLQESFDELLAEAVFTKFFPHRIYVKKNLPTFTIDLRQM